MRFEHRHGRTVPVHRQHRGPLLVQRPFYPESNGTCHAYVLHPPGGLVGGDRLSLFVHAGPRTDLLVTTPAAAKFYRSNGAAARQTQQLVLESGATVEWLPQETLLFEGARALMATQVELEPGARFIGWEIVGLGRRASGEGYEQGSSQQRLELWRGGRPLLLERTPLEGQARALTAAWGLGGHPVLGTLAATPAGADLRDELRARLAASGDERVSVTLIDDLLICRYLGTSCEAARQALFEVWCAIRQAITGRAPSEPRIWRT